MKILGIDLGDARTGLATCDRNETFSSPLKVIHSWKEEQVLNEIVATVESEGIEHIVLGNPLNMDGSSGERSQKSIRFKKMLEEKLPDIEIALWDERLTTVSASYYMNETNTRGKKRKDNIDSLAASIILENYLDYRKHI